MTPSVKHLNRRLQRAVDWWGETDEKAVKVVNVLQCERKGCSVLKDLEYHILAETDKGQVQIVTWFHKYQWVAEVV